MIYLGGVTLGYFNLYPVGFQPKEEQVAREETPCAVSEERLPLEGSRLSSSRRPVQWPLHVFF
ncbi:MAG TPA: hypothetical protein VGN93_22815 [Shinella sp.]|jgi:hypothetical protein|uniref:hypothetical protein n=1 Tax=Shinella sp. TaxID=1870904 RepID=UPI0029AE1D69|nr:hypothetical protein [Shinella sp.]MDX3977386.1 hypothetical protein [Shinella sp.]HEV7249818.1 hypothetical protein [Shinella sp.]